MRSLLLGIFLLTGSLAFAQPAEPTLTVDTLGNATICFSKDSAWSVNFEKYGEEEWVFVRRLEVRQPKDTCLKVHVDLHPGENSFRLQLMISDVPVKAYAPLTVVRGTILPAEPLQAEYGQKDTTHIPASTMWELYDAYGNLVKQGTSQTIPVSGLQTGEYFLLYDNVTTQVAIYPEEHRRK